MCVACREEDRSAPPHTRCIPQDAHTLYIVQWYRDLTNNLKSKSIKAWQILWMVRQQSQFVKPKVAQDLAADAKISLVHRHIIGADSPCCSQIRPIGVG